MRFFTSLLSIAALAYLGLALYLYAFQESFLYFPERQVERTPAAVCLAFEEVSIPSGDGVTLAGWFVAAPHPRATLLFLHGNGGNIGHRVELLEIFHRLGLNVLLVDYRGYGASTGQPSEAGTYRDAQAAWDYLTATRRIPATDIVVFGESLGGAIAAHLAQQHTPRTVVLYAAFTSLPDMAHHYYPYLPTALLARFRYDTRAALAAVRSPLLILHSRDDEITPYHMAEELLAAAHPPKRLVELRGGHNDALFTSREAFVAALDGVLRETAAR